MIINLLRLKKIKKDTLWLKCLGSLRNVVVLFLNKAQFYSNKIPLEINCIKKSLTIVSVMIEYLSDFQ